MAVAHNRNKIIFVLLTLFINKPVCSGVFIAATFGSVSSVFIVCLFGFDVAMKYGYDWLSLFQINKKYGME